MSKYKPVQNIMSKYKIIDLDEIAKKIELSEFDVSKFDHYIASLPQGFYKLKAFGEFNGKMFKLKRYGTCIELRKSGEFSYLIDCKNIKTKEEFKRLLND